MIFTANNTPKLQPAIPLMLLMGAGFGAHRFLTRPSVNYHNPYLTYSPYQPVWTVAIPLAWALILSLCHVGRVRQASVMSVKECHAP